MAEDTGGQYYNAVSLELTWIFDRINMDISDRDSDGDGLPNILEHTI